MRTAMAAPVIGVGRLSGWAAICPTPPAGLTCIHLPLGGSGVVAVLNSEQKALLDFLVLARAQRFAGFGSSTFSFYLREYRALHVRVLALSCCLLNPQ